MRFFPNKLMPVWFACCGLCLVGCGVLSTKNKAAREAAKPDAPESFKYGQGGGAPVAERGEWWRAFKDPALNRLVGEVEAANPDVRAALARSEEALASLGVTRSNLFPTMIGDVGATTKRDSLNDLRFPIDGLEYEQYRVAVNASWEIDLWGRLRAAYRRDRDRAEVAEEEYRDMLLSLRAAVARQYFALRYVDRESAILRDAVKVREEAVQLQESLAKRGAGTELDVERARVEVETTRSEAEGLERTRGKLENALAALTGKATAEFSLPVKSPPRTLPSIPSGVPSTLLLRRPDLRGTEAALRAASEEIGVSRLNYLPRVSLTGTGGFASLKASDLFANANSTFFSLGPQVDIPIFASGRLRSESARAKAQWREALENYRGALLTAVQEVDDSLLDLDVLDRQLATQQKAVAAAARVTELAQKRYDRGAASYFEVVDAQRTELQARRVANVLSGERAAATVQLIQALGGEW